MHLTIERKLSPNSLTGYCSGLRFFYNETLGWDETKLFIPPRKKSSLLPEMFSPVEVVRLIGATRGLKQRVLLMTAYSAGLRVSELVNLKITDIDAERMTLRVKQGKGGKDAMRSCRRTCLWNCVSTGNATGLLSGFSRTGPRTVH